VPWFAAAVFATSGAAAGMGAWLLFSRGDVNTHMLAVNLPLVVSVLWAAAHCVTASVTLWFALGLRRGALGAVANASEVGCHLCMLSGRVHVQQSTTANTMVGICGTAVCAYPYCIINVVLH
jgi:hypothetical protein